MVEDVVDDDVSIGDVDFAVTIHVDNVAPILAASLALIGGSVAVTMAATINDDINHLVYIGNIDLAITVHVPWDVSLRCIAKDLIK